MPGGQFAAYCLTTRLTAHALASQVDFPAVLSVESAPGGPFPTLV